MSRNKPDSPSEIKNELLEESNSFCILPWIHLHTIPIGLAAPCCVSTHCASKTGMGSSTKQGLLELVNCDDMKEIRLDMLNGNKHPTCVNCHRMEESSGHSHRISSNKEWEHRFDEVIANTNFETGELENFKMSYFDIRFSNICNFKCRTCGSEFSSKWEQEDLKSNLSFAKIHPKNNNPKFLSEVIDQLDYVEHAYFAGGEPLITDEHYIILEELIKKKRTDVRLRYNTNLSNFNFKNKDIFELWNHFEKDIEVYASLDHFGDRAEYIRHGTKWSTIEHNYQRVLANPKAQITCNTVLSVYNGLTIFDFYKYMHDNRFIAPEYPMTFTLTWLTNPDHLAVNILPKEFKKRIVHQLEMVIDLLVDNNYSDVQIKAVDDVKKRAMSIVDQPIDAHWLDLFRSEKERIDKIRNESFEKTFPELKVLF